MTAYRENQKECVITKQGQANIFKQGNGFKWAIIGYALIKDTSKWLWDKCMISVGDVTAEDLMGVDPNTGDKYINPATGKEFTYPEAVEFAANDDEFDFNPLRELTLDDIKEHCNIIFRDVTYSYDENLHRPNPQQYARALAKPEDHLFPVNFSYNYDEPDLVDADDDGEVDDYQNDYENTYISYDVVLDKKLVNVIDVTGDQTFDGIIYLARPYMNEPQDDGLDIIDPQVPILFAVQYFAVDKLMILEDQNERLVMNVEMHVGYARDNQGEDGIVSIKEKMPTKVEWYDPVKREKKEIPCDYNGQGLVQGIHLANDASSNTIVKDAEGYETTNNLFISTLPSESVSQYDTFAKLNIMSRATSAANLSTPQLMFSLVNDNANRTWNGQRLAFNYASGDAGALFRIHEIKGIAKNRINFELLGVNNLYRGVKGAWGNSFIFSQNNEIPESACNNFYMNSDGNVMFSHLTNNMSFIDSHYNVVQSGHETFDGKWPGVNNMTFFGTSNAVITPFWSTRYYKGIKGNKGRKGTKGKKVDIPYTVGGYLSNHLLLDSDYSFLNGHNNSDFHATYIASPSAKHVFTEYSQHDLELGNMLGYTNDNNGNLIAIGRGLNYTHGEGDKIILGHFNENDTDPNNVMIVGDGFLSEEYLADISGMFSAANNNNRFYDAFTGRGDMVKWYRHNLLTVNRNGWIGISDYTHPENSARYGFSGITGYIDGATYDIPFSSVYAKLNVYDSMKEFQDIVDSYTDKVRAIVNTMPTNKSITITGDTDLEKYFGKDISKINSNSIINVTYQTTAVRGEDGFTTTVRAPYTYVGKDLSDKKTRLMKSYDYRKISAYNSLQYLYLRDTQNNLTGFFKINN